MPPREGITLKENGTIHVKPNGLSLRNPPGSSRLHRGGEFMTMYPDKEDSFMDITVEEDPFEMAKLYHLNINFKSNQELPEEAILTVRPKIPRKDFDPDDVIYQTTFSIPNTDGQWQDMEQPVPIEMELGGIYKTSIIRIVFPKVVGHFQIQHFEFLPPNADDAETEGTALWFQSWLNELKTKVENTLPKLEDDDTLTALKEASEKVKEAVKAQDGTKGHGPQRDADKHTNEISRECLEVAMPLLEGMEDCLKSIDLMNNVELLQCIAIAHATPVRMADYCVEGDDKKERLMNLLKEDTQLLKDMLVHGGPKKNRYGQALDIYMEIQEKKQQEEDKSVLPKLALAVALEMAYPIQELDEEQAFIDPVERYLYYEKKYLEGELDPAFESFSVWELRMSITSNARNDELQWSMDMMKTYQPEHVYTRQYDKINPTDVLYLHPEKEFDKLQYHNILSFGGLCGSRAKFGRLAVQTFGIPSWGLVVPGHATFDFWKENGWTRKYGAGRWEGRRAYDFYNETVARKMLGDEDYYRLVELLAAISVLQGEAPTDSHPEPDAPWYTLSVLQRRRFGDVREEKAKVKDDLEIESNIKAMAEREDPETEEITKEEDGTIVVPSFARTSEENSVTWMKSYDGGMQMHVRDEGWSVEYKIPADLAPESKAYNMTVKLATVHDKDLAPIDVSINGEEYKVDVPYTAGPWQESSVEVTLGGDDETTIKLSRTMPYQPLTVKGFKLTPV